MIMHSPATQPQPVVPKTMGTNKVGEAVGIGEETGCELK